MTPWDFVMIWMLGGIMMAALYAELTGLGRKMSPAGFMSGAIFLGSLGGVVWVLPLIAISISMLGGVSLKEIREKLDGDWDDEEF